MRMGDFWLSDAPLTEKERDFLAHLPFPPTEEETLRDLARLLEEQKTLSVEGQVVVIDPLCYREA